MAMPAPTFYTAEMVRDMPDDGNRYETVHGELLVSPSPIRRHQWVVRELILEIGMYLRRYPVGLLWHSPADVTFGSDDTLVQPDVFVAPAGTGVTGKWEDLRHLLLVVEVLSPSTARHDRFTKRVRYQEAGVPLYWIIDPVSRSAEVWTPRATQPVVERTRLEWRAPDAEEPFSITLESLLPTE